MVKKAMQPTSVGSHELYVLVVDGSLVDHNVIDRLIKIRSSEGDSKRLDDFVGPLGLSDNSSEQEFISFLRNGIVLCNAITKIQPGAVSKYFENVRNFHVAVEELKPPAFRVSDLERPSKSLVDQRSTNRIQSRVAPASPVKPGRHLDMSVVTEDRKLDDAVVGALVESMLDQKENIDHELVASFRNGNTTRILQIMLEKRQLHTLVFSGSTRKGPYVGHALDSLIVNTLEIRNCAGNGGLSHPDTTMHLVKSTNDVLNLMKLGGMSCFVSSTALNNPASLSHSIFVYLLLGTYSTCGIVHIIVHFDSSWQGKDSSGSIQRSCLHLVDLVESERVDKSEVTAVCNALLTSILQLKTSKLQFNGTP
ncbi:hypothetical protein GIB67_016170 [Kingdonia uniflora]|uniref:Kinesin motor domain-containing protein n=1 Tax=Kingdonia uniflora TaxID=39325 RepID=A0A7J7NA05_9MAGN|nr:hypothetical protein GIB67_016170 [Kingdonia uniflora]